MIYMLNLVFNASDTTATNEGRFQVKDYLAGQSLLFQSHVWLQPSANANNPPQPDTVTDWQLYQLDTSPIRPIVDDQIWIRVLGENAGNYVARLTITVARNASRASHDLAVQPYQTRASPFPHGQTDQSAA